MKKMIAFILIVATCFSLNACDKGVEPTHQEVESIHQEVDTTKQEPVKTYKLTETIATDVVEITLDYAKLATALESTVYSEGKVNEDFLMPIEYNAETEAENPFVAAKGHALLAVTYTAKNLDRSSVELDSFYDQDFMAVTYKGKSYPAETTYKCERTDGGEWETYPVPSVANALIGVGETTTLKCYFDIPVEPDDLEDTFDPTFALPNSKGAYECFTYTVTKDDRANIK